MNQHPVTIAAIRLAAQLGRWVLTSHARQRAGQRRIGDQMLVAALAQGEILEDYPNDLRGASALILGYTDDGQALHAVCAFDPNGTLLVITTYVPELPHWLDERTRAK